MELTRRIEIRSMRILNFKGVRQADYSFDSSRNIISGKNRAGKTTIQDAWHWLIEGKDSAGRANFEAKTLDENNNFIEHLSHEVEIELWVSWLNRTIIIRRELIQQWKSPKGIVEEKYNGDAGKYFFDGAYVATAREYNEQIQNILPQDVFRLLSDPSYFNNDSFFDWKARRRMIFEMAGELSDAELSGDNDKYAILLKKYAEKGEEKYKQEVAYALNELKKEMAKYEPRIEENRRMRPEPKDWAAKREEKKMAEIHMATQREKIADLSLSRAEASKELSAIKDTILDLERKAQDISSGIYARAQTERSNARFEVKMLQDELDRQNVRKTDLEGKLESYANDIISRDKEVQALKEKYNAVFSEELTEDESKFKCFACSRPYETSDIETEKANQKQAFDTDKVKRLRAINDQATALISSKETLEKGLEGVKESIVTIQAEIAKIAPQLAEKTKALDKFPAEATIPAICAPELGNNMEYQRLLSEIEKTKALLEQKATEQSHDTDLSVQLADLNKAVDEDNRIIRECDTILQDEKKIADIEKRIEELEAEKKVTAQKVADWQRVLDTMGELTRRKVNLLEDRINSLFSLVRFRMFKKLKNGEYEECCECMIDGVPYSTNLNTGNKILAGIDIVAALCRHFGVTVPLFVDNCESVTSDIYSPSQLIMLRADKNVDTLTFNN